MEEEAGALRRFLGGYVVAKADIPREEWLEIRKKGIGGSDAAVVCGLSKFKTPYALWLEKMGLVDDEDPGEAAYWGTVLEPVVAKEFEKRSGHRIWGSPGIMRHEEYEWMMCTPDRLVIEKDEQQVFPNRRDSLIHTKISALLECKTTGSWMGSEWDDEQLPFAAALQVQHSFAVTGLEKAYVPALIGGQRFVIVEVQRDEELIDMIVQRELEFMERVWNNDPPEIDGSDSTTKLINRMYEADPGKVVDLDSTVLDLIEMQKDWKAQAKTVKEEINKVENAIKTLMGDAEIGTVGDFQAVTWKESPRAGYTVEPTTTRILRTKAPKK